MDGRITFTVYGIPQTKGSAKAFYRPGMRFPVVTNDNTKEKPWAQSVSAQAHAHRLESCPWAGPIRIRLQFRMPIPKSLPRRRPAFMTKRPDLDKMVRSVKDALRGVLYLDDAQVVGVDASKVYGVEPGVSIMVEQIDLNYEGAVVYAYHPAGRVAPSPLQKGASLYEHHETACSEDAQGHYDPQESHAAAL